MREESLTLAKELEEQFVELEDHLEKIDPDRIVHKAWATLAHALRIVIEDVEESRAGAFFKSLIRGLTRSPEPSTGKDLRPLELIKDLMVPFLKGPMALVASDAATEVAEALVVRKASTGDDLSADDLCALSRGIENLHGSALYPLSYKFICHTFDELAAGQTIERHDDLPIYPPGSPELIKLAERLIKLRSQLIPTEELINRGLENPQLLGDPRYRSDLKHAVENNAAYKEYRSKSNDLTLAVIGPAATGFLIKALESIPRAEPYLRQIMEEVEDESATADPDYIKMLIEAPPYVRVITYVSEANDQGHHITGTRIPFTAATTERVKDELNGMLSRLFGAQANRNPFYSTQRALFYTRHPVKVEQQYEKWRSTQGLPPARDPKEPIPS